MPIGKFSWFYFNSAWNYLLHLCFRFIFILITITFWGILKVRELIASHILRLRSLHHQSFSIFPWSVTCILLFSTVQWPLVITVSPGTWFAFSFNLHIHGRLRKLFFTLILLEPYSKHFHAPHPFLGTFLSNRLNSTSLVVFYPDCECFSWILDWYMTGADIKGC